MFPTRFPRDGELSGESADTENRPKKFAETPKSNKY